MTKPEKKSDEDFLPRVLGTKRVNQPILCEPLIDYTDDEVAAEFVVGLMGPHREWRE